MTIMFISLKVFLMACLEILNFVLRIFIEWICDVALAHVVITISDFTFEPLLVIFSISGRYFSIFVVIVFRKIYHYSMQIQ